MKPNLQAELVESELVDLDGDLVLFLSQPPQC